MPASSFPFLDSSGPIAFAHQGGANEFPENTMKAFQGAVALGYRSIETDLQVTSDGVLLNFHDDMLDRATDHSGTISRLPWSVVQHARVAGTEPIPKFEDVLDAFPETRFNIEPKTDEAVEPLISLVQQKGVLDRVCIGSFSDSRVKRVRKALGPRLCTGMGVVETTRLRVAAWLPFKGAAHALAKTPAGCTQQPVKKGPITIVDARFVKLVHDLGLQIHVWTINDAAEMRRLLDLGVDGIMTDRPAVLRDVLRSRGAWF